MFSSKQTYLERHEKILKELNEYLSELSVRPENDLSLSDYIKIYVKGIFEEYEFKEVE